MKVRMQDTTNKNGQIEAIQSRLKMNFRLTAKASWMVTSERTYKDLEPLGFYDLKYMVEQLEKKEEPIDYMVDSHNLVLEFKHRRPVLKIVNQNRGDVVMPLMQTAIENMCNGLLIQGLSYSSMNKIWCNTPLGRSATERIFKECVLNAGKQLLIRTILNKTGQRNVRAVQSSKYTPFSDLQLLKAVEEHAPQYAHSGLVSAHISDDYFSCRLAVPNDGHYNLKDAPVNVPIPVIDLRNGNTGKSKVVGNAGIYTKWCTNGCFRTDMEWSESKKHMTGLDGMVKWLVPALSNLNEHAIEIGGDYTDSTLITIDDVPRYTRLAIKRAKEAESKYGFVSDAIVDTIVDVGLTHETTPQDSTLSQPVQGTSLIAQHMTSIKNERLMEDLSLWLLRDGLEKQEANKLYAIA